MPTTIKLKNSVTTTNAPTSLVQGEVAINITDKKVWVGDAATTPIQLLGAGASGSFGALSCTSLTNSGLTATRVTYATTAGLLTDSANLTFNGTTLTAGGLTTTGATSTGTLTATGVATFSAGTVSAPAITTTGDTNTGIFFPAADTIAFTEGGVESMRIDSSGNVGIGTSSPKSRLTLGGSSSGQSLVFDNTGNNSGSRLALNIAYSTAALGSSNYEVIQAYTGLSGFDNQTDLRFFSCNGTTPAERMRITSGGAVCIGGTTVDQTFNVVGKRSWFAADSTQYAIKLAYNTSTSGFWLGSPEANALAFSNDAGTERMRITSGGNLVVGKTSLDTGVAGSMIYGAGVGVFTRSGDDCLILNRLANDGTLVGFYQDTVLEGTISVSGTTVSYNGGHLARWSQLPDGSKDDTILKGTVMANLDDMCVWEKDGVVADNEQLNKMKVSDVEGDTNVAGVFVNWTRDENFNSDDMNVAMTGDMIIRIAQGVVVQRGDLLMSAGDGTAKPQGDDIVRSKTVAKVTSNHVTCTYADGSYCVPCVLMAC
jgi:hypothetical protein